MATHSSVLAWRIPGTEEPGGLPPMELHRVGHDWGDLAAAKWKSVSHVWLFAAPWTTWNSPGQNSGVVGLSLIQGIFPTQRSNMLLLHWQADPLSLPPAAAAAKSLQSCPTLCDSIRGRPPSSPVPGILQARILEWVAISFSHAWKWKVKVKSLSPVQLSVTLWTAAYQAPPSRGFSRREYWSGLPVPSPKKWAVGLIPGRPLARQVWWGQGV